MTTAALTDINPYESPRQPTAMVAMPRVFTPGNRLLGVALLVVPVVILAVGGPALAVAAWVAITGHDGPICWLVAIASLLVVVPAVVTCTQFAAGWSNRRMQNRLARLWKDRGIDVEPLGGKFMELATAGEPRTYHMSSTNWDIGFVVLTADRLVYLGDQTSFALSRDQIVRLHVGPASYERFHPDCIFLTWKDDCGARLGEERLETLGLAPGEGPTPAAMQRTLPTIVCQIERWLRGEFSSLGDLPGPSIDLPAPKLADIPSKSAWREIVVLMVVSAIAGVIGASLAISSALPVLGDLRGMPNPFRASLGGAALAAFSIGLVVIAPHTFRELVFARAAKSP